MMRRIAGVISMTGDRYAFECIVMRHARTNHGITREHNSVTPAALRVMNEM